MANNIDKFLEIENKYNLYHDRIEGENYWNYIRFTLFNYDIMVQHLHLATKTSESRKTTLDEWKSLGLAYLNKVFGSKRVYKDCDVFFIVHPRRVFIDGKYQTIYTDILEEIFPKSISVEIPKTYMHLKNVKTKNRYYLFDGLVGFYMRSFMRNKCNKARYDNLKKEVMKHLEAPFMEINTAYNVNLNLENWASDIANRIPKIKYYKKIFRKMIDRYSPKVIVELVSYSTYNMALNEVARERRIPTIELQHGTMHGDHAAYQYGTDELLLQLPNSIFTYSDYWNSVTRLPKSSTTLISTGFPYFDSHVARLKNENERTDVRTTIVFVSQETIGPQLAKIAVQLAEALPSDRYKIIYKLHPGECIGWREKYHYLLKPNIEVIDQSGYGIYELFANSDIQVGAYSSAIYEGLGFGLRTFIYNIGHANTMKPLVERGYATYFESLDELQKLIENCVYTDERTAEFWKTNALDNVCGEIKRIGGIK